MTELNRGRQCRRPDRTMDIDDVPRGRVGAAGRGPWPRGVGRRRGEKS